MAKTPTTTIVAISLGIIAMSNSKLIRPIITNTITAIDRGKRRIPLSNLPSTCLIVNVNLCRGMQTIVIVWNCETQMPPVSSVYP